MERYIAFDIGDRRIGIAVSDPFNSYALPSQTYVRTGFRRDIEALVKVIREKGATAMVCGLPVNVDGTPSEQTEKTERFIRALEEVGNDRRARGRKVHFRGGARTAPRGRQKG